MNQVAKIEKKKFNEVVVYSVSDALIAEFKEKYLGLVVKDLDDKEGYDACKKARGIVRDHRIKVDNERKAFKAEALDYNRQAEEGAKKIMKPLLEVEDHLKGEQEKIDNEKKRIEIEKVQKAKEILDARVAFLQKHQADFTIDQVQAMTPDEFNAFGNEAKAAFLKREEDRKAEQERLAKLEEERVSQAKKLAEQEAENKRIQAELIAKQKTELAEKELRIKEEKDAREKEKQERIAEQNRLAQEKQAAEERLIAEKRRAEEALLAEKRQSEQRLLEEKRRVEEESKRREKAEADRIAKEKAEKERIEKEAAEAKRKAEAEAKKKIADKALFDSIKKKFPTIESAWVEIARLTKESR